MKVISPDREALVGMLRSMMLIRAFEERLAGLAHPGFQLYSSGEEAVAVGICENLVPGDQLLTSGRAIGPALARGMAPQALWAELLGKAQGPCKGKGGRGHLAQPSIGFFGAHSVVGGNLSVAAGVALAGQMRRDGSVVVCIFGDGACGSGSLHETLNLAALWRLPLVLVCNNNQYSVSTRVADVLAPATLSALAAPFGIPARTVDGMDVCVVSAAAREMVAAARQGDGPSFLECVSYRFESHSTSSRETRPKEEISAWRLRCPIQQLRGHLQQSGKEAFVAELQAQVKAEVEAALALSNQAPPSPLSEATNDV